MHCYYAVIVNSKRMWALPDEHEPLTLNEWADLLRDKGEKVNSIVGSKWQPGYNNR